MPFGFSSFSFDLFGLSWREDTPAREKAARIDAVPTVQTYRDDERPESDRHEAEQVSFWGLGFFPVL
ncbi:hypothetical protein M8R20_09105 [Pseudomonas sp. R2.Fl]|nr:hypothetical protein [Pseudomonas sp. R2.Fl]MCL6707157.1 hypothetical protein [Pseudomonas sp. R2.Fl]